MKGDRRGCGLVRVDQPRHGVGAGDAREGSEKLFCQFVDEPFAEALAADQEPIHANRRHVLGLT